MNLLHAPVGRPRGGRNRIGRAAPRTNHAAPTSADEIAII